MDELHTARAAGRLAGRPIPDFTLAPITINLRAYPLDAAPSEIVIAGQECRKLVRDAMGAVEKRIAPGAVALFGHLECSPPKQADDVEPYLISTSDPAGLYTVVHLHAWIVATVAPEIVRRELVQALEDRTPQPRRIRLDERHHETQDLETSVSEWLHYGVKHLHSITGDDCDDDVEALFWLARWRKYLRGDGLRGSRISINLEKFGDALSAFWNDHRETIFTALDMFDAVELMRIPERIRADYYQWKRQYFVTVRDNRQSSLSYSTTLSFDNSCLATLAELLMLPNALEYGTRFWTGRHFEVGFGARAPPVMPCDRRLCGAIVSNARAACWRRCYRRS